MKILILILGTLGFIKFHIMNLLKSTTYQISNSICFACSGVSRQESFITFLVKLAQSSTFPQDIAFATKYLKICIVGLSTIQELIWYLLFQWVTIEAAATIASHVDSFGPKRLTHIVLTKHRPLTLYSLSIDLAISMSVLFFSQQGYLIVECTWPRIDI